MYAAHKKLFTYVLRSIYIASPRRTYTCISKNIAPPRSPLSPWLTGWPPPSPRTPSPSPITHRRENENRDSQDLRLLSRAAAVRRPLHLHAASRSRSRHGRRPLARREPRAVRPPVSLGRGRRLQNPGAGGRGGAPLAGRQRASAARHRGDLTLQQLSSTYIPLFC